ncbi:hypothetical protein [Streptomyces sp. NPDC059828]|uniref:DUF7683 domain-containing protein n=1 Tax=Streptomyces sp. NPDC059828 TaxID=3346965 RepID=UPI003662F74F
MRYLVVGYGSVSETVEQETDVSAVGSERLARLVGVPLDEFVDVYPLDERLMTALTDWAQLTFTPETRDYFLEVVAE